MRAEHAELKKLMAEIAVALEAVPEEGLTTPLAALTARIYAHNGKEERILYPMTDRLAREAGTLDDLMRVFVSSGLSHPETLWGSGQRRNYGVVGIVAALAVANGAMHAEALGLASGVAGAVARVAILTAPRPDGRPG